MKVVQINSVCESGSTGKICVEISKLLTEHKIENYILYSLGKSNYPLGIKYINDKYIKFQAFKSRICGNYGFNSELATKKLIDYLNSLKPDIIHLHNLHGHNINLTTLFKYLKTQNTKIYWTFHDCWAFTGYCSYYDLVKCEQWKKVCQRCPLSKHYSWLFDKSNCLYNKKKELFSGLDLTIITPSLWLAEQVKQSFLSEYEVKIINNGIDLTVFKPTASDFRAKYNIPEEKFILLGVAFGWGKRKGLDVFVELSTRLDKNKYQIVLVGTDNKTDKLIPNDIISIHRTQNQAELAQIYTVADLFVNPTREEVLGLVNVESLACGTPVVTFKSGGSPECIDETCGSVVACNDVDALEKEILRICQTKPFIRKDCIARAKQFDTRERFLEYMKLYE